ncbi:MAG: Na+/H+ antiporter NhaC [Mogibacterium sp.]|nr:Na+/H+ antiporter NhaC [Mogibacterium sp.]
MKNIFTEEREIKETKLWHALTTFIILVVVMSVGILIFEVDPHIPMFIGVIASAVMAMVLGYKWSDIEKMMVDGISKAMQSILILAIVGMMIGAWILSGTIPTMIYYGLKLLSPKVFLIATVLICSITSLATGTSWGTMGTMGLALIGIGHGLGMPIGPTAGAVLAGAYFGDKMSPLSDTTNLAPAMAGTDVFTHVKYMLKSTVTAYGISLLFFGVYGFMHATSGNVDTSQATILMDGIKASFNINPLLLLPPLVVILSIAFKVPAIPGITMGFLTAAVMAPFAQSGADIGAILDAALDGYTMEGEIESLNDLLTTGGLTNMSSSILMTIIAMMFGGIMEGSGQLAVIINAISKNIKTAAGMVGATEATCILSNVVMPEQYISILVPGRMFAPAYRERGIHPKSLSNALESAGTVTSCLVPWNTCGLFIKNTLGVTAKVYAPWAVFNYTMPVICFAMAFMGVTATKMTEEERVKAASGELV